jgi:hypothetical protein
MTPTDEVPTETLVIGEDFYGPDPGEGQYRDPGDAISNAIGSTGYVNAYVVDDCVERFADGSWRDPETFDRFYWDPEPLLIDVLQADNETDQARERDDKHVEFKTKWCADNGRRYVVLSDADTWDPELVARKVAPAPAADVPTDAPTDAPTNPPKKAAGKVQRPRRKS